MHFYFGSRRATIAGPIEVCCCSLQRRKFDARLSLGNETSCVCELCSKPPRHVGLLTHTRAHAHARVQLHHVSYVDGQVLPDVVVDWTQLDFIDSTARTPSLFVRLLNEAFVHACVRAFVRLWIESVFVRCLDAQSIHRSRTNIGERATVSE